MPTASDRRAPWSAATIFLAMGLASVPAIAQPEKPREDKGESEERSRGGDRDADGHSGARSDDKRNGRRSDEIVVTASGIEHAIQKAPASISVVTRDELEKAPFRDLTDALRNVEGVSITGPANEQDIFIRGLPGAYTLILVDGRRQTTRDTRVNGNSGFEQSFLPPMEAIERIEVVRGPMSSLYGSDAIGGVVNVITRNVSDRWRGTFGADVTVQGDGKYGNSYQQQGYFAGPVIADKVGVQLWGHRFHREEAGIVNALNGAEDTDINGRIAFRPARGHEIVIEAGTQRIRRESSPGRTLAATSQETYNTSDRDHFGAWYDGKLGDTTIWASIQQEETQRYNYSRNRQTGNFDEAARAPNLRNRVGDLRVAMPLAAWLTGVIGGQWIEGRLIDQNPGTRQPGQMPFSITQWAAFAEAEVKPFEGFSITGGARLDHHEVYGSYISPRLYAVWEPIRNVVLKGGVTTGFRAPEIRQIAPGYAYTTGGAGCTYGPNGTCGVIIGDPGLEAEKSTSYELNLQYDDRKRLSAGVSVYSTEFRDKISDLQVIDAEGNFVRWSVDPNYRLFQWTNLDRAVLKGVEATFRWTPARNWTVKGGYTYTYSRQRSGNYAGYALARTPEHMANGAIEWRPLRELTTYVRAWYHGEEINAQLRAGSNGRPITTPDGRVVRFYPGYTTADVGLSYKLKEVGLLNLAVQNVTDKRLDDLTYNTVNDGRRVWMGLTVRF